VHKWMVFCSIKRERLQLLETLLHAVVEVSGIMKECVSDMFFHDSHCFPQVNAEEPQLYPEAMPTPESMSFTCTWGPVEVLYMPYCEL